MKNETIKCLEKLNLTKYYDVTDKAIVIKRSTPTYYLEKIITNLRDNKLINTTIIDTTDNEYIISFKECSNDEIEGSIVPLLCTISERSRINKIINNIVNELTCEFETPEVITSVYYNEDSINVDILTMDLDISDKIMSVLIERGFIDESGNIKKGIVKQPI